MTTTLKTLMMRLKLQRTAAAAAVAAVAARAPSPQAKKRRMAKKEKTLRIGGKGRNKNTYLLLSLQHGVVALPGRFIIIAFVSCINMWCFQPERRRFLALFA